MSKVFPPDKVQTQPNQGRAKLFVSDLSYTFEIKGNNFQQTNILQNSIIFDNEVNFDSTEATISNVKPNKSKSFTFEQFDKINIPPNKLEAKIFSNKIQNSLNSVSVLPIISTNTQETQSNDNTNIDYSISNLHILFSKDDYRPIPFHVSPATSISSPFNNNIQIYDQNSNESNDKSKFQISNGSVAYRQCIDLVLNNNFELSDISTFSAELIPNAIQETQNVEIYDIDEIDRHKNLSLDNSFDIFEQFDNSHNETNKLGISQLSSYENEKYKSDSIYEDNPTKETKSIKIQEKQNHFNSKSSIQTQNFSGSTKSSQSTNLDDNQRSKRKSKAFKFVKFKSINLINDENLNSNKIDDFQSTTTKSKEKLHSDPIFSTANANNDDETFPSKSSQVHHSSSLKPSNIDRRDPKELKNEFEFSPAESFASEIADDETEKNSNSNFIPLSPNLAQNKKNKLKICSVSYSDFNIKSGITKDLLPKFEESEFETLISLDKVKALDEDSTFIQTEANELETKECNDDNNNSNDNFGLIHPKSIMNADSDKMADKNVTPRKKKKIPRFTTSELSTMANVRYSPQIDNLKYSNTIINESENSSNLSFQESEIATMTSIKYVPAKVQVQESFPISVERIKDKDNSNSNEVMNEEPNKKQIPKFTTSDLSTMANVRYSPQKVERNHTKISEKGESLLLSNNGGVDLNQTQKARNDLINIEESELTVIVSVKYDPSIPQIDDEQQQQQQQEELEEDIQMNVDENERNQQDPINEIEEEEEEFDETSESNSTNQTKSKISTNIPQFTTSGPSTMANIRFSPKSSYLSASNDSTTNDHKHNDKNSAFSTPNAKRENTTKKKVSAFSISKPSGISSTQTTPVKRKLKNSQTSFIEVGERIEDDEPKQDVITIEEEEEDYEENENNNINIRESEMTTITSINYVPYQHQQHANAALSLSEQFIIENSTDDLNNEKQNNKIAKPKLVTREIIQTKPRKQKQVPSFSTSEPSAMTNLQSTEAKIKLKESKVSLFEVNEPIDYEEPVPDINLESSFGAIQINEEEEEEEKDQPANKISLNESEMTIITSINYIPYQQQQQHQENTLVLSKQTIIENISNDVENETKMKSKMNQRKTKIKQKASQMPHNKKQKIKQIPTFSTSDPSAIANLQPSSNKESKVSFVETDEQNANDSNSKQTNDEDQIEIQIEEEEEEENEEININQSEMTTIASIDYEPNQQQEDTQTLSNQFNDSKTTEAHSKPNKIAQSKKTKSKEVPLFSISEPSTLTNLQSSSKADQIPPTTQPQSEDKVIDDDFDKFEPDNQNQDTEGDAIDIEESDFRTIASIKCDSSIQQEKSLKRDESDKQKERNNLPTPRRNDKKVSNQLTTIEPISNSSSDATQTNDQNTKSKQVKIKKKSNKEDKETKTESTNKQPSFETSDMLVISEDKPFAPTNDNRYQNEIGIQSVRTKNHSNYVANEPITIENPNLNQPSSAPHKITNDDTKPHFELSELTMNANIKLNNSEKARLKQSESLSAAFNSNEKTNELDNSSENIDNNNQDKMHYSYMAKKKELSQLVTFENHPIQRQLKQSKAVVSESPKEVKKKSSKTKKKADLVISNKADSDDFITNDQENVEQETNSIKEKFFAISKNEDFFINNNPTKQDDYNNNETIEEPKRKKKAKQKEVNLNLQSSFNRIDKSAQTTDNNDNNNNNKHATLLLQSGTFCIETNDKEEKVTRNKKKQSTNPELQKQSISSQTDDLSNQLDEKEKINSEPNKVLTLSNSLACDSNSNQNSPQFEQSLITTISNISMSTNEQQQQKTTVHLSFQQNPSTIIKEENKNKDAVILFNSKSESFQLVNQESAQLSLTSNNQLDIPPESKQATKKSVKKSPNKKFKTNETQTESEISSFSNNNEVATFDLTNNDEIRKEKSFEAPKFESSNPTTILSLNEIEVDNHPDYLQASTQISVDLNSNDKYDAAFLETSPVVAQNVSDEKSNLTSSGVKTVANIKSDGKQKNKKKKENKSQSNLEFTPNDVVFENKESSNLMKKENKPQSNLKFTSNDVVFENEESSNLMKKELVLQPQYELSKVEDSNHSVFEMNEPSTIVSIPFNENSLDLAIEDNKTLFEINEIKPNAVNKEVNLEPDSNQGLYESNANEKIHFELSDITNITDITEFNSNENQRTQKVTEFTKEFQTSLPVSIYSSNANEQRQEDANNQSIVVHGNENEYSNQVLFEQKPEKSENSDCKDFKQSDLINILSINKDKSESKLTSSNFAPININMKQANENQSSKQKSEPEQTNRNIKNSKIVCEESEPFTLVSIQNKKPKAAHKPKFEFSSTGTIFNNNQLANNTLVDAERNRNTDFKVSNLMCFEKSIQTSMTKVFGSIYLKASSPVKQKAQLSVNPDSQFCFEDNSNENDDSNELRSPMKVSRSLENLDSFTIKKEQKQMTMIFGSFSVSNEKGEAENGQIQSQSNNNSQNQNEDLAEKVDSVQQKSIVNKTVKQSIETQTVSQNDNESIAKKKPNLDTVFGCFEIQSPTIENVEDSKKETIDAVSQTSKSIQKESYDIVTGTNCSLDLSPQTTTASTSTENRQPFNRVSDSFDINSPTKPAETGTADKKDDLPNQSKESSLSMTKTFGRFDISPGTYDNAGESLNSNINDNNENEEGIQAAKPRNYELDGIQSRPKLSFNWMKSFCIENEINRSKNLSLSRACNDFYIDNQIKGENSEFKPDLTVENEPVSSHISYNLFSSEIADISKKENQAANLEKLSLNSINIEPTNDSIQKVKKVLRNQLSIGKNSPSINLPEEQQTAEAEAAKSVQNDKKVTLAQLSIDRNSPSINLPETIETIEKSRPDKEVEINESPNMLFEVPMINNNENDHFDLLLNQSEIQIQPSREIQQPAAARNSIQQAQIQPNMEIQQPAAARNSIQQAQIQPSMEIQQPAAAARNSTQIQREIVTNKSFEIPLIDDDEATQNRQYEDDKNVEIKASFPLFFEFLSQPIDLNQYDDDIDIEDKIRSFSITNSSPFYVRSERDINQMIEEEEEDKEEEKESQVQEADFNSPIFSNIELCKKLIGRQIGEIKSLEKEIVKKDVAYDSLNKKFELFKESTKKMLSKHFGEIRSLNETNAKLVSQIDSLQARISSKNDAVFSHLRQRTATCSIVDPSEVVSIEPAALETMPKIDHSNVLVTVTVEDIEPSTLQTESTFNSNRRLFISNPSSYEETGLFSNFPLLRESGKITQFSLLPKSSFIPLKVDTNLNFEKKEMKPSLTFSFFHLRVTRPKFYSTLHLEDNLTVAHILPQKVSKTGESVNSVSKNEIRRNIERSQFFLSGEDDKNKKNGAKQLSNGALSIEPSKKLMPSSNEVSFEIAGFSPKLAIKRTQAISFIAQKRQK